MVKIYVNDAMARVIDHARMVLTAVETGEALHKQLVNLANLTQFAPMNTVAARRSVADKIIAAEKFIC
jgi:hypothetical protein